MLTSRERVNRAIRHCRPDRTPRDFAAVPEVWDRLQAHFRVADRSAVLRRLGVDCRVVSYDAFCCHPELDPANVDPTSARERSSTSGMWRYCEPDGSNRDIWGAHRKAIQDAFGQHEHFVSYPLASAEGVQIVPALPVQVVDSVGAGDAFNAGLAVGLAEGRPMLEVIATGVTAASLSTRKRETIASYPCRAEVDAHVGQVLAAARAFHTDEAR
jgi:hypothetical protein